MADTMSCDSLLKSALESLNHPVKRLFYSGNADTFLTYQLLLGNGTNFADDSNECNEYAYRVDLYSKTDYVGLLGELVEKVKSIGFYDVVIVAEVYEKDTGYFHIPIEIKYLEEL